MGRKPDPLILEFFERGQKLDDQSNRYEQTCKRCGHVVSGIATPCQCMIDVLTRFSDS